MKHELGESYTWQGKYPSKIVICIPPITDPAQNPEKCRMKGKVDDYYWGAMNTELYDFWTYCIAVDQRTFRESMGSAMPNNFRTENKLILIRPKELYETNTKYVRPEVKAGISPKAGVTGAKKGK